MTNQEVLENKRVELINDLIAITTVMDALWEFHPENPKQEDVVEHYAQLLKMKGNIEDEIDELEI
mgnify:CR=1 FL=1|tara:strand:+ start:146 stop:340 length:195 start_codon:yes stop_codon:yes gene_type:complete